MTSIKADIHTISILVANKPGVLVRVAQIFARRGYNVDSLVVSASADPRYSRMTITAQGNPATLDQIIKQCSKLIDVMHAEEHNADHAVSEELALVKVKATPSVKTLIEKNARKYQVKIVDDSEKTYLIQQTGTSEKLDEFEALLKKHTVIEMVRSGKLLMAKGKEKT